MPWYAVVLLICLIIGPFDALYLYIKQQKRREKLRKEKDEHEKTTETR